MQSIIINTTINFLAMIIIALGGLIVARIVINEWDVAIYGLIILLRNFLHIGAIGLFDTALSEVATLIIAKARARSTWLNVRHSVGTLYLLALLVGVITSSFLLLFTPAVMNFLNIDEALQPSVMGVIQLSAIANIFGFLSRVSHGIIIGYEKFSIVRLIEIISFALFLTSVFVIIAQDLGFIYIATAYVLMVFSRSIALILLSFLFFSALRCRIFYRRKYLYYVLKRINLLLQVKLFGAIPNMLVPIIITALSGPLALGLYDIAVRISRLAKMLLGLIPSALLPVIPKLRSLDKQEAANQLIVTGLVFIPIITIPVLIVMAANTENVLTLWLGAEQSQNWLWATVAFIPLILGQFLLVSGTILVDYPQALRKYNLISIFQICFLLVFGIVLTHWFDQFSFIFCAAISAILVIPIRLSILFSSLKIPNSIFGPQLLRILMSSIFLFAVITFKNELFSIENIFLNIFFDSLIGLAVILLMLQYLTNAQDKLLLREIVFRLPFFNRFRPT